MAAMAGGTYQGQSAFAVGLSKAMTDGHTVVKLSGSYDTRGKTGGAAGVVHQFQLVGAAVSYGRRATMRGTC